MRKKLKEKIIDKLKEYDISIFNEFEVDDEIVIVATNLTISIREEEIFISFYLNSRPSYVARIMTILYEIKEIQKLEFFIGDDYVFDDKGKLLDGKEAIEFDDNFKKQETIQQFIENQSQIYYLNTMQGFHC